MIVVLNKKFYAKIYFNQIQGALLLNGRLLKQKSMKIQLFNKFLDTFSISVNIKTDKRANKIITNKLLLRISSAINRIVKKNKKYFDDNNNFIINLEKIKDQNKNIKNTSETFNLKNLLYILLVFFLLVIIFIYDYKSIETKINQSNYFEIKKIESNYKINKCEINGNLSSLKQKCELMLNQIELLKTKKPSLISVFFIWLLDILNSYFSTFNLINCIITIIFIIIIYKLLK
jgi:hypothetical protein